jgi:hypothetical protein
MIAVAGVYLASAGLLVLFLAAVMARSEYPPIAAKIGAAMIVAGLVVIIFSGLLVVTRGMP